jgi:Domain of unknown function (DUF4440)
MKKVNIFVLSLSLLYSVIGLAQKSDKALFEEIYRMDSMLFRGLNERKIEPIEEIMDKNLEFYHDKSGLTNYEQNVAIFKKNFEKPNWGVKRRLLKETMEVYPIPNFGAMQIAKHEFCNTENGQTGCGILKFAHVWKLTDGKWTLIRIMSYDH